MKIKISELRQIIQEIFLEMKLGLSSANRTPSQPEIDVGSQEEDIIDYQRNRSDDDRDEFTLRTRPNFPKTIKLGRKLDV